MEEPSAGAKWGLAALLGCGACCGGLAATATWAGATTAALAALAAGWVWVALAAALAAGLAGALLWRRRSVARDACARGPDGRPQVPDETP